MISVMFKYVYSSTKTGRDDFQYCEVEVSGHSAHTDAREQIQVCSAVSAIVNGIYRLVDDTQFFYDYGNGYFHIVRRKSCHATKSGVLKERVDKDTNLALNTILCQLYEVYLHYPKHFIRFDLIELKEYKVKNDYEYEELNEQGKFTNARTRKQYRRNKVGFSSSQENND